MSAIFEEVNLEWAGEVYSVTPTYRMIQQIEQHYSIAGVSQRLAEGNPPMSHIAGIIAMLLSYAGADVDAGDVYDKMLTEMDGQQIADLAEVVVAAFVPSSKNSDSPAKSSEAGEEESA